MILSLRVRRSVGRFPPFSCNIKSLDYLKSLSTNENGDFEGFYVLLANGLAGSSKDILYDPEYHEFSLINEIDESFQEFHSSEIDNETNLIQAKNAKALFKA